jgi:hypothetical protein
MLNSQFHCLPAKRSGASLTSCSRGRRIFRSASEIPSAAPLNAGVRPSLSPHHLFTIFWPSSEGLFIPMFAPTYYNVHWEGPFDLDTALTETNPVWALYMICGTHSLYGRSVPLYIGQTSRTVGQRIGEHQWIETQPDPVQIYLAAISPAISAWSDIDPEKDYPIPESQLLNEIESLLIYAHQPGFNSRSIGRPPVINRDIAIFNTGRRSSLLPELSTMYWID